jgi:prepilin-type N-terminal cleavage/methylation domain-containing protein
MINIDDKSLKSAFTLIEMLVVMALMALMIGIGVSSFYGIGGSSALNGSVNEVQGALSLARQQTVMQNSSVNIYFYRDENSKDIVYQIWAMTNTALSIDVPYGPEGTVNSLKYEIEDAENDGRDNKYGYKLGALFHFPKGLEVKVNGDEILDNNYAHISLRPTGVTPEFTTSKIKLTLTETGGGYDITIFNITGLTKVEETP